MFEDSDDSETDDLQSDGLWNVSFLTLTDPRDPGHDFELVKVGITKGAVETRVGNLQTGNPYHIQIREIIRTPVARALERWVHRTQPIAHLEWLELPQGEIQLVIDKAKAENERLCEIATARTHWGSVVSNGNERPPSQEEARTRKEGHCSNAGGLSARD